MAHPYISCASHLCLGLRESHILLGGPAWFPLEFSCPFLSFLIIQSLILALLDGLADGGDTIPGVDGRLHDAFFYPHDLLQQLGLQLAVRLLQPECALQLQLGRWNSRAPVTIGSANDGVVKAFIFRDNLQLGADKRCPRVPP